MACRLLKHTHLFFYSRLISYFFIVGTVSFCIIAIRNDEEESENDPPGGSTTSTEPSSLHPRLQPHLNHLVLRDPVFEQTPFRFSDVTNTPVRSRYKFESLQILSRACCPALRFLFPLHHSLFYRQAWVY